MTESDFFKNQTHSSRIKANIVANYFPKYCKIILKSPQEEIRYLDLFAGPGIYEDGSLSTPILIGDACNKDETLRKVVRLMFNDNEHIATLKQHFDTRYRENPFNYTPSFGNKTVGDDERINQYLTKDMKAGKNPYPTLLFFDPFGYKCINTNVLTKYLCNWGNELFLFFNIKRIHAAVENEKFDNLMTELFPTTIDRIRNDRKYAGSVSERLSLIIANLSDEFKKKVPNLYHCAFRFQEEDSNTTSHYIIHFTKHNRGYDLVKQIYNDFDNIGTVLDENGDYTFDSKKLDSNCCQLDFGDQNIYLLANQLLEYFKGRTVSAAELYEEHQRITKYCRKHYCDTLRYLVSQSRIRSSFTDNKEHSVTVLINEFCIVEFI
jgi:three-Cys-motif partner protein